MIRLLTTILFLTTILIGTSLSQKAANKFIDKHKEYETGEGVAMTLPGWLIRSGMNFAENFAEEEDEKAYLSLGQYIKKLRFLAIEKNADIDPADISWLIRNMEKDDHEEYVSVRSDGTNVKVWVKENNDIVENLVIMARENDSFALITMKTQLPLSVLKETNFSFNSQTNN